METDDTLQPRLIERIVGYRVSSLVYRHWLTIAFLGGFLTDLTLLNRVDDVLDNIILALYVLLAITSYIFLYVGVSAKVSDSFSLLCRRFAPMVMQYAFGGLLSGMIIFYGRSSDWLVSWPVLLLIAFAIIANETVRDRAARLIYNSAVLYIGLLLYLNLVSSVLTGWMGPWIFIIASVLASLTMWGVLRIIHNIIPRYFNLYKKMLVFTMAMIFIVFQAAYFLNIIPPIPLSLKHIGIYQSVVKIEEGYALKQEPQRWWRSLHYSLQPFTPDQSQKVFCYTEVYAPGKLRTDITHRWEWYDETAGKWRMHSQLSYPIIGGRESGYRGFTHISNYQDGRWRCSVVTGRGQVLGSQKFILDTSASLDELETSYR